MEILFRGLAVVALVVGVVALVGRPDAPESDAGGRDGEQVRRIAALEQRVRELESAAVPSEPGPADAEAVTGVAPAGSGLDAAIDRRLDERLPRFRESLVTAYRLDAAKEGPETGRLAKPETLEAVAERIGLNGSEVDFIRAEREAMNHEIMGVLKEEGESDAAFEMRMRDLGQDPEARAEATQKIMTKVMTGGGLARMLLIQGKHDKAILDRIGKERFREYKALEPGISGGNSFGMTLGVHAGGPDGGR